MGDDALSGIASLVLVGAGKMGGAMLEGWLDGGLAPQAVTVLDPGLPDAAQDDLRARGLSVNPARGTAPNPDVVVLAVKPQMMAEVLGEVHGNGMIGPETLTVSVAAGWTIANFEAVLGGDAPIVRVMPNTPAAIGEGMLVGCANSAVDATGRGIADSLMASVGRTAWIDDEALMDAVTAVSGSGPAYVFYLAETLAKAGRAAGLPDELADTLARATVAGAGALIKQTGTDPAVLRRNVTSPNGTTAAALAVLMADDGLQPLLTDAVEAAAKRSRDLAN